MSTAAEPVPLLPLYEAYRQLAPVAGHELIDAARGSFERLLSCGEICTEQDLWAKALLLQDTARIDPGLISMETVDTLVAGVMRLFGPTLNRQA